MTKLEFHKDKNFLMDWLMLNQMTTGEIVLWHTLMNIGNRLGQKTVFNAPTSTLMKFTGLSKQGIMNARKKLMERGFIRYKKGQINQAPVYEMFPLHQELEGYYSFKKDEDLTLELTGDLTHEPTKKLTIHKVQSTKEKSSSSRGLREENPIFKTYEENMNRLNPMIKNEIRDWLNIFSETIIEYAILQTVKQGGRTFSYLEKILIDWKKADVKTIEDIEAHELAKEIQRNKKLIPFRKKADTTENLFNELLEEEF